MKSVTHSAALPHQRTALIWGIGLSLIIVLWSFGIAFGGPNANTVEPQDEGKTPDNVQIVDIDPADDDNDIESVTMSIALEEGGVIDLDAPVSDVKIERWDGDEVLVIVEKTKRSPSTDIRGPKADAVNIQVTRRGKNVRIETSGGTGWDEGGMDLSFRIVLPNRFQNEPNPHKAGDTMTRLTSTLWRAVHKEALKLLVR
ncbi:MAG: hypothetical protein JSW50_04595 [Candidatus Latescibacterota bacterium]|nr:MAG: hypothetical protein JSW50_04595 [Candidatus Latescibacterota bacterium]